MRRSEMTTLLTRIAMASGMAIAIFGLYACGNDTAERETGRLSILTAPTGSIVHSSGSAIASIVSQYSEMTMLASSVSGPQVGAPRVNQGQADFTLLNAADAFLAVRGTAPNYQAPHRNLRLVAIGFTNEAGILVRRDSDIENAEDLRDQRITGVFSAHKTCEQITRAQLANLGLSEDDVHVIPVTHSRTGVEAMADGRAEVAMCVPIGQAIVQEVNAQRPMRFLSMDDSQEAVERARKHFPAGEIRMYESGSSTGVVEDVNVWSYPFYLVTHTGVSDEVVYDVVKTIAAHVADLREVSSVFDRWNPDAMIREDMTLPVHEGARRYYRETGYWNAAIEAAHERQLRQVESGP